jgi:hypothetical protein
VPRSYDGDLVIAHSQNGDEVLAGDSDAGTLESMLGEVNLAQQRVDVDNLQPDFTNACGGSKMDIARVKGDSGCLWRTFPFYCSCLYHSCPFKR